ncbi:glutamine amidotransferase [Burkholderia sp. Ax-1719]|uniref:glutamine amidotransferase n=1 Tax=Burkholderia sp. Ax-1719 TaxID=2608334 RepID=UPI00141E6C2B|nr:glutamine amidotransferase [Burkholderia sp. Ax-1719]NIE66014.1 glutamine amidotransferase [Burkholderia sp. Ax-1719]
MMSRPVLIVATGSTFPQIAQTQGDFGAWIANGLGQAVSHRLVNAQTIEAWPDPSDLAGVVLSGSHSMVSDREPWSERLAQWLTRCVAADVPVLGICYGHQLLAHAFGGLVSDRANHEFEIGTHTVGLSAGAQGDPLFDAMPQRFGAQLVHRQSVVRLPDGAFLLAASAGEACQAFRVGRAAWGVQFHPEFSTDAMRAYIHAMPIEARDKNYDADALSAGVCETPDAASLLPRFAAIVQARESSGEIHQAGERVAV